MGGEGESGCNLSRRNYWCNMTCTRQARRSGGACGACRLVVTDAVQSGHGNGLQAYCDSSAGRCPVGPATGPFAEAVRHRRLMMRPVAGFQFDQDGLPDSKFLRRWLLPLALGNQFNHSKREHLRHAGRRRSQCPVGLPVRPALRIMPLRGNTTREKERLL